MIRLSSAKDQERVREAIQLASEPGGPRLEARIALYANGESITDQLEGVEWFQSDLPISLDATIYGYLPNSMTNAQIKLVTEVAGVPIQGMHGEKSITRSSDTAIQTDLIASSTGSLLSGDDAIKLGEFTEFYGLPPSHIARDIAIRAPYAANNVEIEDVPNVHLTYAGAGENPGFLGAEPLRAPLDRMGADQTVGYHYRDTANNGLKVWIPKPLSALTGPAATYHASVMPDWLLHRPSPPLERYSAVRMTHYGSDGRELWTIVEEVPYLTRARRPHKGRYLEVAYEDSSELGKENARDQCRRMALDLARLISYNEALLPTFNPLLELDDDFRVSETAHDRHGTWDLLWGMRVAAYKHLYGNTASDTEGAGLLATLVRYEAILLAEDKIQVPTAIIGVSTPGVIKTIPSHYVQGDDLYLTTQTNWASVQGDDVLVSDESPDQAYIDGDDLVVGR